jgi:2'-5' RNA ligase superfamily
MLDIMKIGDNLVTNRKLAAIFVVNIASVGRSGQALLVNTYFPRPRILPIRTSQRMSTEDHQHDPFQNTSTELSTKFFDPNAPPSAAAAIGPQTSHSLKKYHHLTVCMVPPESSVLVWETITKCRTELKDPGLYRWPPHANLLYPFIDLQSVHHSDTYIDESSSSPFAVNPSIIHGLLEACRQVEPFHIKLHQFGTFGSKKRGVLWLYPDSFYVDETKTTKIPPLVLLQSLLVQSFPQCNDQNMKSNVGFNPHMTVSHFINHEEALAAQNRVEQWWPSDHMVFPVRCIYLLQRDGDAGQFLRVVDIPLGSQHTDEVIIHPSPLPFLHMPSTEVDWVLEERMKLKQRRNGQWRSRSRHKGNSRRSKYPSAEHDPHSSD